MGKEATFSWAAGAVVLLAMLVPAVITGLKRRYWLLGLGFFLFPPLWLWGAIRLAQPSSWWPQRFYNEEKRARARMRYV